MTHPPSRLGAIARSSEHQMPDSTQIKPFTTDGCSGGMSRTWNAILHRDPPWEGCCVTHDLLYWAGGTREARAAADLYLRLCVEARGHPVWAWAMWIAVRLFGGPHWPHGARWGYGHRFPHGYDATPSHEAPDVSQDGPEPSDQVV